MSEFPGGIGMTSDTRDHAEATAYFEATVALLQKLLDWKKAHDHHDHVDEAVATACLREWGYLEHQGKVLIGSGPA